MSNLNLEYFKEYYNSGEFDKGLQRYFPNMRISTTKGYPIIFQVSRHFNNDM